MVAVPIFSIFYKSKPCLYIKNQRKQVEKCHKRGEALEDIGHGLRLQRVHCKYGGGEKWDEGPGTRDRGRGTRNQRPTIRVWKEVTSPWFPVPEVRSSEIMEVFYYGVIDNEFALIPLEGCIEGIRIDDDNEENNTKNVIRNVRCET